MAIALDDVEIVAQAKLAAKLAAQPPESAPPPQIVKRSRPKWAKWALVIGIVALVGIGVQLWRMHAQNAIGYETVAVDRGTIQASVTATGTVNAVVDVQVGSQVSGNIKALYADFNTKVTKGQLVALIDPEAFQAQVDQAQAALSSVHSTTATLAAQVTKAMADVAGTVASGKGVESIVAKDRANELNAKTLSQRADALFAGGLIAQQDRDSAKATYDAAQAQTAADQAQIDASKQTTQSAQAQVQVAQSQLSSGRAQERQAQGVLDQAKINLAHTRITAPVDGTVIARRMDVGQTVAASFAAPTIFEIAQDLTKMQLDTNVDESDIGTITVGQTATFTVDAYPGTTFRGQVSNVRKAPIVAQNVVTYDVVITVPNPDLKLFPGMTANAKIITAKVEDTLKVPNAVLRLHPAAAVLKQLGLPAAQNGKPTIYAVPGGKLQAVPVTFGLSDGKFTSVTSGNLQVGENVVVRFTSSVAAPSPSTSSPGGGGSRRGPGL
jgi:HlyD family secretion protein